MNRHRAVILAATILCTLLLVGPVLSSTEGPVLSPAEGTAGTVTIDWWVVGGGGGPAGGTGITVNSTLGQPIIGLSNGNSISLGAGYWYGVGAVEYRIYLPLLVRSN